MLNKIQDFISWYRKTQGGSERNSNLIAKSRPKSRRTKTRSSIFSFNRSNARPSTMPQWQIKAMEDASTEDLALMKRLRSSGLVKHSTYRLRNYPSVLVGQAAVDWMLEEEVGRTKDECIARGQALMDAHLLHHVSDEHQFAAKHLFYRFYADEAQRSNEDGIEMTIREGSDEEGSDEEGTDDESGRLTRNPLLGNLPLEAKGNQKHESLCRDDLIRDNSSAGKRKEPDETAVRKRSGTSQGGDIHQKAAI